MAPIIDLNADLGESFGLWSLGQDAQLMPELSSANVACGFHAGDPATLHKTVALALKNDVQVGAHPGFSDRVGFGRRDLAASPGEIYTDVLYQLGALEAFLRPHGRRLHHVKAHGALYLKMHADAPTTEAVAQAVRDFDVTLPLVVLAGPGGTEAAATARELGLTAVLEAFPDRAYLESGGLAPRSLAGAVLHDPEVVAARAVQLAAQGRIETLSGGAVELAAQTLCLHGDTPHAVQAARAVRRALGAAGVRIEAF